MARRMAPAGVSHDPEDAAVWTHRIAYIYYPLIKSKILAIIDEDRTHYPFLKQWVGMEVDQNTQWSINNGVLGLDQRLHNAEKHLMEYCIKLKPKDAEFILKTPHNMLGIANKDLKLIYAFQPLQIPQLAEMLDLKKYGDSKVREVNYGQSKAGWQLD